MKGKSCQRLTCIRRLDKIQAAVTAFLTSNHGWDNLLDVLRNKADALLLKVWNGRAD